MHQDRHRDASVVKSARVGCLQGGWGFQAVAGSTAVSHGRGFTLVEIIIVVVILAISAMMAIPMMSSAAGTQIRAAASAIAADLEYARSMAITRQQSYTVAFDCSSESYEIRDSSGAVIEHPVRKGLDYRVSFQNDRRLNMVDIVSVDFNGTTQVKFDYLGSPYDAGNNPLNSGTINLQAGNANVTVSVEPVTGYISVSQ